jgi:Reverse transcriptase (RNA-dependent DNA polymerase)
MYKLKKALYGLKQASRTWYDNIDAYFTEKGFRRSPRDPTLYVKHGETGMLIVSLYVDDLIFTGNDEDMMHEFKNNMMKKYEMNDLGCYIIFVGIEIDQRNGVFISQKKYAQNILSKFKMENYNPVMTSLLVNEKLVKKTVVVMPMQRNTEVWLGVCYILPLLDPISCILRDYCLGLCINRVKHILELQKEY